MSLEPCPSSPNCISSQADAGDKQHYMAPIAVNASATAVLDAVEAVLGTTSGVRSSKRSGDRIDAVFVTRILRFKDDVTFLVSDGHLHFRSASRVGKSDLGANRKRMSQLLPQVVAALSA